MDFDRIYDRVTEPDDSGFGGIYDKVMPAQTTKRVHGGASGKFTGGGGEFDGAGASVKFGDSASEAGAKEIAAKVKLSPIDKWFDRTLRNKEPEKTKELYAKAGDFLTGSAADFSRGFYSTLDFILPDEIINRGDNRFSKFLDDAQRITREKADKKDEIIAEQGKAGQIGLKILDGSLQALPQVLAAILSGGTSTAAQGAGLAQTAIAYLKQLVRNPSFYLSLTQTLGKSYEDAVADGATEQEAASTAIISSLLNSAVEVSGGIEKVPGSKRGFRNWVKGMAEEGGEEVVQGVIDQLTRKAVYDPDRPLAGVDARQVNRLLGTDIPEDVRNALLSTTGEDAVFDPVRAAQEFGLGAAVGGLLGGGEMAVGKAVDTVRGRRANAVHGAGADASAPGRSTADGILDSMLRAVYGYGNAQDTAGAIHGEPVDSQIKGKDTPQKTAYPQSKAGGRADVLPDTVVSRNTEPADSGIPGNGAGEISFDDMVRKVMGEADAGSHAAQPGADRAAAPVTTFGREGEQHGRRPESRESFLDRVGRISAQAEAAGYPAVRTRQIENTLYALLPAAEAAQSRQAREIRRILAEYGIPADIVYETQANADGVTRTVQGEATALPDCSILIKNDAGLDADGAAKHSPEEIAAHEMTHEAKRIAPEEYWAYYNLVMDEAIVTNQEYLNFTDAIIRTYFTSRGRTFDITTDYPALYNELTAFIGGRIYENEVKARERYTPMFQDFDAVVDAWRRMEAAVRAKAAQGETRSSEEAAAPQDYIRLFLRVVRG